MTGSVSAAGNIRGNYFLGNGYYLTGISGVASTYGNSNVAAYLPTYTGNLTANVISTTGNITGSYIFGNGSQLTGITTSYGNANTAGFLANFGSNTISTTGSISAGDVTLNNLYSPNYFANAVAFANATGYITTSSLFKYNSGTEVLTVGAVSATGNITANYFVGNGSQLTDLPAGYSNADVSTYLANSNVVISTTGNITGSYILGNGSQLTGLPSGSGNTGNVTFDDVNIIGTGNLNLQPNGASNEYLNIYLTGNADIHVAAGGGVGNVILGTDEQANVAVLQDGNVAIQAGNVSGTKTWNFDTTGNLTLPLNSVVYETNIPDGGLSGSAIALKPPGGTNDDQQLLIYPTTNDANHLHLTSGNLYSTELFFGSDDLYVKLANTGNIVINSNDGIGNSAQWTFDTTGNLTTPGGMIINGNTNTIGTQTALLQAANDLPLSFIASGANGLVTSFWAEDFANLMTSNIAAIYTPLQNTQTVRIVTGSNGGNIAIYDFDNQGMFTAAAVCATGNVYAGNIAASGNVTGAYILGNGSGLTSLPAPVVTQDITSNGAMSIMTYDGNIKYVNNATIEPSSGNIAGGNISASGNITGSNILFGSGIVSGTGNINGNIGTFTTHNGTTFSASGNITGGNISTGGTLTATGKIGYASGSTVTQLTSRGTGVSINTLAGTIITTSAAMVATEIDTFSVTNSSVDPNSDIVLAQIVSPNQGTYNCIATPATIGGFNPGFFLSIVNISGFTTSDETITIRFMIIKAPNA
jgi:hypothetical protein